MCTPSRRRRRGFESRADSEARRALRARTRPMGRSRGPHGDPFLGAVSWSAGSCSFHATAPLCDRSRGGPSGRPSALRKEPRHSSQTPLPARAGRSRPPGDRMIMRRPRQCSGRSEHPLRKGAGPYSASPRPARTARAVAARRATRRRRGHGRWVRPTRAVCLTSALHQPGPPVLRGGSASASRPGCNPSDTASESPSKLSVSAPGARSRSRGWRSGTQLELSCRSRSCEACRRRTT